MNELARKWNKEGNSIRLSDRRESVLVRQMQFAANSEYKESHLPGLKKKDEE